MRRYFVQTSTQLVQLQTHEMAQIFVDENYADVRKYVATDEDRPLRSVVADYFGGNKSLTQKWADGSVTYVEFA